MWRVACMGVVGLVLTCGCGEVKPVADGMIAGEPVDDPQLGGNPPGDASGPTDATPDTPTDATPDTQTDTMGNPTCGGRDQDCCVNDTCNGSLACVNKKCRCGGLDQPCCTGTPACDAGCCNGDGRTGICGRETDARFCSRNGKNCGSFTATDSCGVSRTANCGSTCATGCCGMGGMPNVCGTETDPAFCSRYGKACGAYADRDICGVMRTANCGGCSTGCCGGAGVPNQCGSQSQSELCKIVDATCGIVSVKDLCNVDRFVSCGSCACPLRCNNAHHCAPPPSICMSSQAIGCSCDVDCCSGSCNPPTDVRVGYCR